MRLWFRQSFLLVLFRFIHNQSSYTAIRWGPKCNGNLWGSPGEPFLCCWWSSEVICFWILMLGICQIHVKYVRYMWNICQIHVKYMSNKSNIFKHMLCFHFHVSSLHFLKHPHKTALCFFADEVINNNLNPVWDADNKFTMCCLACLSGPGEQVLHPFGWYIWNQIGCGHKESSRSASKKWVDPSKKMDDLHLEALIWCQKLGISSVHQDSSLQHKRLLVHCEPTLYDAYPRVNQYKNNSLWCLPSGSNC